MGKAMNYAREANRFESTEQHLQAALKALTNADTKMCMLAETIDHSTGGPSPLFFQSDLTARTISIAIRKLLTIPKEFDMAVRMELTRVYNFWDCPTIEARYTVTACDNIIAHIDITHLVNTAASNIAHRLNCDWPSHSHIGLFDLAPILGSPSKEDAEKIMRYLDETWEKKRPGRG